MSRLQIYSNLSNIKGFEDFQRFCSAFIAQLYTLFNGQIDFNDNIRASPLQTFTTTGSNEVVEIVHGLRMIPKGFLVIKKSVATDIYAPTQAIYEWTDTKAYLTVVSVATVSVYII